MNKAFIKGTFFPERPVRNVLARIGSKWTLVVLYTLEGNDIDAHGVHAALRFMNVEKTNHVCSQKMLTQPLRGLEADGLVSFCAMVIIACPARRI